MVRVAIKVIFSATLGGPSFQFSAQKTRHQKVHGRDPGAGCWITSRRSKSAESPFEILPRPRLQDLEGHLYQVFGHDGMPQPYHAYLYNHVRTVQYMMCARVQPVS